MDAFAQDIMNKATTTNLRTPLVEVAKLMQTSRISILPVVDSQGRLSGVVSKTDLVHILLTGSDGLEDLEAQHAMNPAVVTCEAESSLKVVASLMIDNHIHHVFIVDSKNVVWVISSLDLARPLIKAYDSLQRAKTQ